MFRQLGNLVGYVSDKPSRRGAAAGLSVLSFGTLEFAVHQGLAQLDIPPLADSLIDSGLVGFSFGLAVWVLLRGNCERRRRVRHELQRLSELNHEIRNALEIISYSHHDADAEHRTVVMESVARIDIVLKRLFPVVGGRQRKPPAKSSAKSGM